MDLRNQIVAQVQLCQRCMTDVVLDRREKVATETEKLNKNNVYNAFGGMREYLKLGEPREIGHRTDTAFAKLNDLK